MWKGAHKIKTHIFQCQLDATKNNFPVILTRHRLGCFCTHHSLGGGSDPTPPLLSRKRMDVERRTRLRKISTRRFQTTFKNLKLRSRVRSRSGQRSKSGVFRLQTVVTSNVAFFAQNFPYVLPRTRRRY